MIANTPDRASRCVRCQSANTDRVNTMYDFIHLFTCNECNWSFRTDAPKCFFRTDDFYREMLEGPTPESKK